MPNQKIGTIGTILVLSLLMLNETLFSQTDREFWFVAPEVSNSHEDRPINFTFITTNLPAHIWIEMPANQYNAVFNPTGFQPYAIDVPAFSIYKLDMTAQINVIEDQFATLDGIPGKNKKGIHITSNNLINCYYELGQSFNPEIIALKGYNALGTEFFCSFQNRALNMSNSAWTFPAYSAFEVVITENNTYLTITVPPGKGIYNGAGAPLTGTFTIGPFNRGETYQGAPAWITSPKTGKYANDRFGRSAADHLGGTRVVTNGKKVAITLKDDSMKSLVNGCYNIGADQTIPVSLTGTEYIVMKGQLTTGNLNSTYYNPPPFNPINQETIYITATDTITRIMIDDTLRTVLNAGESLTWELKNAITRVTASDSGVYVWQITGTGCECGGAILPPVSVCSGSQQVGFTRSTSDNFFMNILVRKKATDGFRLFNSGVYDTTKSTLLSPDVFTDIPGSQWAAARISANAIPVGVPIMITNDTDVFHLGIINGGSSNGTRYGYFSDYNPLTVQAFISESGSDGIHLCKGESAQIVARGGESVHWSPPDFLSDPESSFPIATPPTSTQYKAYIQGHCDQLDSTVINIEVSEPTIAGFTLSGKEGVSPYVASFNNTSVNQDSLIWFFPDTIIHTVNFESFSKTFINDSDSLLKVPITLQAKNGLSCADTYSDTLLVWPQLKSIIYADKVSGCTPFVIHLKNTSLGKYNHSYWTIEGKQIEDSVELDYEFNVKPENEVTTVIYLKVENKWGFSDSTSLNIIINPLPIAGFSVTPDSGNHHLEAFIQDTSKFADTLFWNINGSKFGTADSVSFYSIYTNEGDTLMVVPVSLEAQNSLGCKSMTYDTIRLWPLLKAVISADNNSGCAPLRVHLKNASLGMYNHAYWTIGGKQFADSTDFYYEFKGKSEVPDTMEVRLKIINRSGHSDSTAITIVTYNNPVAGFSVKDHLVGSPYAVEFFDTSTYTENLKWIFPGEVHYTLTSGSFEFSFYNPEDTIRTVPVSLVAFSANACPDTASDYIQLLPLLDAVIESSQQYGCEPLKVQLRNKSLGKFSQTEWYIDGVHYGDATELNLELAANNHQMDTVEVKMIIANEYHTTDTAVASILVYKKPDSAFTMSPLQGSSPLDVRCISNSENAVSYTWIFPDTSITSSEKEINHTVVNPTNSILITQVALITENSYGCSSSISEDFKLWPKIIPNIDLDKESGCTPLLVNISNATKGAYPLAEWKISGNKFLDENPFSQIFTNNKFRNDTVVIQLIVTDPFGVKDSTEKQIIVLPNASSGINSHLVEGCSPLNTHLVTTGNPTTIHHWTFSDGETFQGEEVYKSFVNNQTGDMLRKVVLTSEGEGLCSVQDSALIIIWPLPSTSLSGMVEICAGIPVSIKPLIEGERPPYQVEFSDGTIASKLFKDSEISIVPEKSGQLSIIHIKDIRGCSRQAPDTALKGNISLHILEKPTVVTQPLGAEVYEGSPVNMLIEASGTLPIHYFWMKDNAVLFKYKENSLALSSASINDDGNYWVEVSNTCGRINSDTVQLVVHKKTGVDELSKEFRIYPNPADKIIYLENMPADASILELYDMTGIIVKSMKPCDQIKLEKLANGIYLLNLKDSKGNSLGIRKIVIGNH